MMNRLRGKRRNTISMNDSTGNHNPTTTAIMNLSCCKNLISSMSLFTLKNPSLYSNKPISRFSLFFYFSSKTPIPDSSVIENYLITRHGLSPETALKASTVITRIRTPEKSYTILAFLEQIGFSNTQLDKTIDNLPDLLASDLDNTLKPKIKFFQDSGLTPNDIAEIISCDPLILNQSLDGRLVPSVIVLKRVLGTSMDLSKALKLSAWFLKYDLEKTMIPNIELLMSCGSSKSQVIMLMSNFPRFFVRKPDFIKDCVNKAKEFGHRESSKMFIHAIRVLSSMSKENWELKLDLFRKQLGWSEDEILHAFRRAPQVFAVSERKIKEVTGFLFSSGRCDSSMLAHDPELLVYSLETRIKPRIQMLDILERKNLLVGKAGLATILRMNDNKFFMKYVVFNWKEIEESIHKCKGS